MVFVMSADCDQIFFILNAQFINYLFELKTYFFRRMQVGVGNNSSSSAGGGSGGVNRSVGQRIKEASLKEQQQLCSGSNGCAGGCGTLSGNGVCANSNGSGRVARTLYPGGGAATSSAVDLKQKRSAPMPLSDVQRNTIRVIGQYLRDLGMK